MKGFLLTSSLSESGGKQLLNYFGQGEQGPFKLVFEQERPLFFIDRREPAFQAAGMERKPVALKSFGGEDVDACYFNHQQQLYQLKDQRPQLRTFESDVRLQERFLMERFIFGTLEVQGQSVMQQGLLTFHNPQVRACSHPVSLSTLSFDIETSRSNDLFSIALHHAPADPQQQEVKEVFMVGESHGQWEQEQGQIVYVPDEKACYLAFERRVQELDPDLLLGWHVVGFDMAFLERKCQGWNIPMRLGRGLSRAHLSQSQTGNQQFARLDGRVVIDGPPFLRAAFYQFENFKLDTVAHELLGTRKDIEATGLEKVQEIERRFVEDKKALAHYNLLDCTLVTDIMKKTGLVQLLTTRVQITGLLIDRLNVSTAAFDFVMLPLIHRKGLVAPNTIDISRDAGAAGGHVLTPQEGLHDHVIILDFTSLYPSIIRTFHIDPYSRLMAEQDPLSTPAGVKFSRSHHLLPKLIENLMERRHKAKEVGDRYLSQAIKILMNSFYGVMGSGGSRFYHADLPHAITGTGQWLLREAVEFIEGDGFEVVYGDTDSVFVKLNHADKVFERGKKLAARTNEHLSKVLRKHFNVESALEMEFETYYRKIFFPTLRTGEGGAKKKYAGLKYTKESGDELSFSGMEFVRSDWTKLAKDFQFKIYQEFFAGEPVEETIRSVVNALRDGELDHQLTYKKRLSKRLDEYTKSLPPHVKAAKMAKEAGLPVERDVYYVMSRRGPIPSSLPVEDFDYQHYIDKQIRPIAEVVLGPLGMSFDSIITGDQLSLF